MGLLTLRLLGLAGFRGLSADALCEVIHFSAGLLGGFRRLGWRALLHAPGGFAGGDCGLGALVLSRGSKILGFVGQLGSLLCDVLLFLAESLELLAFLAGDSLGPLAGEFFGLLAKGFLSLGQRLFALFGQALFCLFLVPNGLGQVAPVDRFGRLLHLLSGLGDSFSLGLLLLTRLLGLPGHGLLFLAQLRQLLLSLGLLPGEFTSLLRQLLLLLSQFLLAGGGKFARSLLCLGGRLGRIALLHLLGSLFHLVCCFPGLLVFRLGGLLGELLLLLGELGKLFPGFVCCLACLGSLLGDLFLLVLQLGGQFPDRLPCFLRSLGSLPGVALLHRFGGLCQGLFRLVLLRHAFPKGVLLRLLGGLAGKLLLLFGEFCQLLLSLGLVAGDLFGLLAKLLLLVGQFLLAGFPELALRLLLILLRIGRVPFLQLAGSPIHRLGCFARFTASRLARKLLQTLLAASQLLKLPVGLFEIPADLFGFAGNLFLLRGQVVSKLSQCFAGLLNPLFSTGCLLAQLLLLFGQVLLAGLSQLALRLMLPVLRFACISGLELFPGLFHGISRLADVFLA